MNAHQVQKMLDELLEITNELIEARKEMFAVLDVLERGVYIMSEHIEVDYETISTVQMRKLRELVNSSLLLAFTPEDYRKMVAIFCEVMDRLEEEENA